MKIIKTIFYVVLIVLGVSFAALNATKAPVNCYIMTFSLPVAVIIAIAMIIGTVFGFCLLLCRYWRLKAEHRRIKNQLILTEQEIKNLRSIPVLDQH